MHDRLPVRRRAGQAVVTAAQPLEQALPNPPRVQAKLHRPGDGTTAVTSRPLQQPSFDVPGTLYKQAPSIPVSSIQMADGLQCSKPVMISREK